MPVTPRPIITRQPGSGTRIIVYLPTPFPSCPPLLESLLRTKHIFIRQGVRGIEPFRVAKDTFEILNSAGERIFVAKEITDALTRICCTGGGGHPFEMSIRNCTSDLEALAINASPDCYGAWSGKISQNGVAIGFVDEDLYCCGTRFSVKEAQGKEVFRICGPDFQTKHHWDCFNMCGTVEFDVYSCNRKAIVGKLSKHWTELSDNVFLTAETFGISFPRDISVRHKALLLGTLFILDFNHFKTSI